MHCLNSGSNEDYKHSLDFQQKCSISTYLGLLFNLDMATQHKSEEVRSLINGAEALLKVLGYDVVHIQYEIVELVQVKDIW